MRSTSSRLTFLFVILTSFAAEAQFYTGAIAGGTGGAGRAANDPAESAFLNPASVAQLTNYSLGVQYQFGDYTPALDGNSFAVLISDGTPGNLIPGAFSYIRRKVNLPNGSKDIVQEDFQLSLGGFVFPRVSVGVAAHHLIQKGSMLRPGSSDSETQTSANVAVMLIPLDNLGISLIGYDVIPVDNNLPQPYRLDPVYALGTNLYLMELFSLRFDAVRPTVGGRGRTDLMVGLESFFNRFFAIRLGNQWRETAGETNITAGLGYRGPKLSLDYSIQHDMRAAGSTRHLIDLWMPL